MIEEALYYLVGQDATTTGLIGSGSSMRMFPEAEEQEHAKPCLIYEKVEQEPVAGIWYDSGWWFTTFRFLALADSAKDAKALIEALRGALQRYHSQNAVVGSTSHKIDDIRGTHAGTDYYDYELKAFAEEIELKVFHT